LTGEQAKQAAQELARAEQDKIDGSGSCAYLPRGPGGTV
jgi:hypothetical protein